MPWCWEDLANAVILQAIKDYRNARRRTRTKQSRKAAQEMIREGLSWDEIGELLIISISTAKRWTQNALEKLKMPEKPISIKSWVGLGRNG